MKMPNVFSVLITGVTVTVKITVSLTCEINGPIWFFNLNSLPSPFSTTDGNESNRRVWPVGAVSNTTTEKFIPLTSLHEEVAE